MAAWARCHAEHISSRNFSETQFTLRLFDGEQSRQAKEFESDWRNLLHAWNLLQFAENLHVTSSELIERSPRDFEEELSRVAEPDSARYEVTGSGTEDGLEILEFVVEAARPIVEEVVAAGLPKPGIEFELPTDDGRCGPTAELAWPEIKLCVLFGHQVEDQSKFQAAGWSVEIEPVEPTTVTELLKQIQTKPRDEK